MNYTDNELEQLWDDLSNIAINDDDEIEQPFLHFEQETNRFEIWQWFDKMHSKGIEHLYHR
jgi:hypothetical protein